MARKRTIYMPDDLWNRLNLAAARAGLRDGQTVSVSEYIRAALEQHVERISEATPPEGKD